MQNPIKQIYKFNKEAGLLDAGYSNLREPAYLIEEALEGFENLDSLAFALEMDKVYDSDAQEVNHPKEISRWIVSLAQTGKANYKEITEIEHIPSDLELFDKHIDAFVYTVGSMAKLGLSPQQIEAGIAAVMHSNFKKIGSKKDSEGKQLKPDNWDEIEAEQNAKLQKILDQRQK